MEGGYRFNLTRQFRVVAARAIRSSFSTTASTIAVTGQFATQDDVASVFSITSGPRFSLLTGPVETYVNIAGGYYRDMSGQMERRRHRLQCRRRHRLRGCAQHDPRMVRALRLRQHGRASGIGRRPPVGVDRHHRPARVPARRGAGVHPATASACAATAASGSAASAAGHPAPRRLSWINGFGLHRGHVGRLGKRRRTMGGEVFNSSPPIVDVGATADRRPWLHRGGHESGRYGRMMRARHSRGAPALLSVMLLVGAGRSPAGAWTQSPIADSGSAPDVSSRSRRPWLHVRGHSVEGPASRRHEGRRHDPGRVVSDRGRSRRAARRRRADFEVEEMIEHPDYQQHRPEGSFPRPRADPTRARESSR